jgi:hypothetical protein
MLKSVLGDFCFLSLPSFKRKVFVQRKHIILYLERVLPFFACLGNNITLNLGRLRNSAQHCWHFACLNCSFSILKIESIFRYFTENSGLFQFVSKQFCLFRLFRYRFETPKQTEKNLFWFHETNRNKRETDLVSVCFGSNRNIYFFISRTP